MLLFSTHQYSCEIVVVGLCIGKHIGETDNVHCDVHDLIVYARLAFCMCTLHEILYIDHFEPFVDCLWLKGDWGCGIDVGPRKSPRAVCLMSRVERRWGLWN